MTQVSFSVSGGGLTDIARNVLLSDDPGRAMRLLTTALMGDGADEVARKVLAGDMRLKSVVEGGQRLIQAIEQEDQAYKRQLAYIYAGRFKTKRGWMRPESIVETVSVDARKWAAMRTGTGDSAAETIHEWNRASAEFYATRMEEVFLVDSKWTIWSPCGEIPYWWQPHRTMEEALKEALECGRHVHVFRDAPSKAEAKRAGADPLLMDDFARGAVAELTKEAKRASEEARIREEVQRIAGDDTFDLTFRGQVHRVPRKPFECWALGRSNLAHMAPAWKPVSRSGLKLQMDDEYHTDWLLGGGFALGDAYDDELTSLAWGLRLDLQAKLGGYECTVVNAPPDVMFYTGEVGVDVVVLPDLSPRHAELVMGDAVRAVVAEQGGALAHVAVVGRERGLIVLRVPGALASFPVGCKVTINLVRGSVSTTRHQ